MLNDQCHGILSIIQHWLQTTFVKILHKRRKRRIFDNTTAELYLERIYLAKVCGYELVLHHFLRPDTDFRFHNHPWKWSISFILGGGYVEERLSPDGTIHTRNFKSWNGESNPAKLIPSNPSISHW